MVASLIFFYVHAFTSAFLALLVRKDSLQLQTHERDEKGLLT